MNRCLRVLPLAAALCLPPAAARAQAEMPAPAALPIRAVSLFTSGVSYIERGGTVDGDASVALLFPTDQVNDLLKSLVLLDSGGQVQPVTYGTRDPVSRTLQSFAIDVSQPTSRADLLQKLRGARVSVTLGTGAALTGQIVGVETRTEHRPDGTVTDNIPTLNLLTDAGLQSVDLNTARAVQILDPRLNSEFKQALTVLASGADNARRPVTLHFAGQGRRAVRVGYVGEAPLWKVSYRLLLGGTGAGTPAAGTPGDASNYLQGWALVENTTDDDWNGVRLSLVSGRPVSFIQDLYQPLYLPRPVVPPDVVASPYPQTHGANLQEDEQRGIATKGDLDSLSRESGDASGSTTGARRMAVNGVQRTNTTSQYTISAKTEQETKSQPNSLYQYPGLIFGQPGSTFDVNGSVRAQAQGASIGEQYAYNIGLPVTLPRQQAAMIPIVAQDIGGDKVLLYNADTDPKFPLDAVRLRNTTRLHLKGGPVTLFDGGTYAGDARMEDVSPGETRLISYAVDLSVQGEQSASGGDGLRTSLYLNRGVLTITRSSRSERFYTFKSHADGPRTIVVEQAYRKSEELVEPAKADERTPNTLRFNLPIQPGKTATLTVVTRLPYSNEITLFNAGLDELVLYANDTTISAGQRATLQSIVQQRRTIDTLRGAAQARTQQVASFTNDQERIRKNMQALDKASALYKRYAGELDTQETQIQRLRAEAAALSAKADAAANTLRARLDTLTL